MWDERTQFCDVLVSALQPIKFRMILDLCSTADVYSSA